MSRVITPNMSMKQMQDILDKGGEIVFSKGAYNITKTMWLSSNTTVECYGVTFYKKCNPSMIMTRVDSKTVKYKGAHDIKWTGGMIISDGKSKTQSNIITIVHAKNVTIDDVKVRRAYAPHCIEINASRDVTIKKCGFSSHVPPKAHKEAIQLDFANYAGLSYADADAPTYDGTHCKGIKIEDCHFFNVGHAIGTHTVIHGDGMHEDICIADNSYYGRNDEDSIFVKLLNMKDVLVTGNHIDDAMVAVKANALKTETKIHGGTVKVSAPKKNVNVIVRGNETSTTCSAQVWMV